MLAPFVKAQASGGAEGAYELSFPSGGYHDRRVLLVLGAELALREGPPRRLRRSTELDYLRHVPQAGRVGLLGPPRPPASSGCRVLDRPEDALRIGSRRHLSHERYERVVHSKLTNGLQMGLQNP